jgi:hypothetical protein
MNRQLAELPEDEDKKLLLFTKSNVGAFLVFSVCYYYRYDHSK